MTELMFKTLPFFVFFPSEDRSAKSVCHSVDIRLDVTLESFFSTFILYVQNWSLRKFNSVWEWFFYLKVFGTKDIAIVCFYLIVSLYGTSVVRVDNSTGDFGMKLNMISQSLSCSFVLSKEQSSSVATTWSFAFLRTSENYNTYSFFETL